MANERGHYGSSRSVVTWLGQAAPGPTTYVGAGGSSAGTWFLGALAIGGAVLWARHQSQQVEQLYKTAGLPHQSFGASLRETAKELPARARAAYRGLTSRGRSSSPSAAISTKSE